MILIGAGGHALSLAEFASGIIDGYLANEANSEMVGEWLGKDDEGSELAAKGHLFHMAYIYSGLPRMESRKKLIDKYLKMGCRFQTIISPTAVITSKSIIGEGSAIMQGAIINRAVLGENCVVNSGAIVEHDCVIGDNTFIGPGAVVGGFTTIGSNCFIGLGARIGNGIHIADNISVAMGAIINRNLSEPGIYHGNPLRLFKFRN